MQSFQKECSKTNSLIPLHESLSVHPSAFASSTFSGKLLYFKNVAKFIHAGHFRLIFSQYVGSNFPADFL